jgi:hypothetical protein
MKAPPSPRVARPVMYHHWNWITFLHWRYPPAVVQRLLPPGLTAETSGGTAWVGLTPSRWKGSGRRRCPRCRGCPREGLLDRAEELAALLADKPGIGVATTKSLLRAAATASLVEQLEAESAAYDLTSVHPGRLAARSAMAGKLKGTKSGPLISHRCESGANKTMQPVRRPSDKSSPNGRHITDEPIATSLAPREIHMLTATDKCSRAETRRCPEALKHPNPLP